MAGGPAAGAAGEVRVVGLHRFPVKSLLGEPVDVVDLDVRGVVGDRTWSVRTADGRIGSGKDTRRFRAVPGLLGLRARTAADGVRIVLPGGEERRADDPATAAVLSAALGRAVSVQPEGEVSHFDDGPVSLVAAASVREVAAELGEEVDPGRFRANVLLDGLPPFGEDALVGHDVRVGGALLRVSLRSVRCAMVDLGTADAPPQRGVLRAVGRLNGAHLGVVAHVVEPGRLRRGDRVVVDPAGAR